MSAEILCACGCGEALNERSARRSSSATARYKRGHARRGQHHSWKGGGYAKAGYRHVYVPNHPRASATGYVMEHIVVVERALGRPLPAKHPVHHFNGRKDDNVPGNLVICEDAGYHQLLEQRTRALRECGNASFRFCRFCQQWDDPANDMYTNSRMAYHRSCRSARLREARSSVEQRPCACGCATLVHAMYVRGHSSKRAEREKLRKERES